MSSRATSPNDEARVGIDREEQRMYIGLEAGIRGIRLGVLTLDGLSSHEGPDLDARWDRACEAVTERFTPEILSEDDRVLAARRMLWENGVDPMASPPSCERLIRRILESEPFPPAHPFVRRGWIGAMDTVFPISVFDRGLLPDSVTLRKGKGGEGYLGVLGEKFRTDRSVTLYDRYFRPIGGPAGDSVDTAPRRETRSILVLFYAGDIYSEAALQTCLSRLESLFLSVFGGRQLERRVVG